MNLGENIYKFRTQKNMSQGDLADALDVSRQSVSKWENNSATPELEKLIKMSEFFGITLDELVSGTAPEPEQAPPATSPMDRFSRRQIVGILFACSAVLIILAFAISGQGFFGLLPAIPFLACCALCFSQFRHLVLWCIWTFALPAIFTPIYEFIRIYDAIAIMVVLWLGMLVLTIWCLHNDPVKLSQKTKALLFVGYVFLFIHILFCILKYLGIFSMILIRDRTISYWADAAAYLIFVCLLSVTTRLLKKK